MHNCFCNFSNVLPHFTYEHAFVSTLFPLHCEPPLKGPSQFRVRDWVPSPHAAEQADHAVQTDHVPSTNQANNHFLVCFFMVNYRVSQVSRDWVLMTWIYSVPLSAGLCLGWWELWLGSWARWWNKGIKVVPTQVSAHLEYPVHLTWAVLIVAVSWLSRPCVVGI